MGTTQLTLNALQLPSSPFTEGWITVLVSILSVLHLLLLCIKPLHFDKTLLIKADGRKSLFEENEQNERWSSALLVIFCAGSLSLLYYVLTQPNMADFSFMPYLYTLGYFCLFAVIKVLLLHCVGYVFFTPLQQNIFFHNYQHLFYLTCSCIFPFVLAYLYLPDSLSPIGLTLIGLALLAAGILLTIEIFQLFFQNFVAGFYILLYLCTLEILPYYGLFLWIEHEVWKV